MKITKNLLGAFIVSALFFGGSAQADQTGDCTAGDQYCEQNSLATTNTTTTTNNNTNVNTNTNTNIHKPILKGTRICLCMLISKHEHKHKH